MSTVNRQPIEAANAEREFAALAESIIVGPYSQPLADCLPAVHQSVRDNFTSSATPENVDWPPRKIEGDGHPLLIDTGAMMQAATGGGAGGLQQVDSHELLVGVDGGVIPYAATHNYGRSDANIPQREFMGLTEEGADECESILADFVMSAIFGEG